MRRANIDVAALGRTGAKLELPPAVARVAHSPVQATTNFIPLRFTLFALGSVILFALLVRTLLSL